jgi:hypothetical protein
VSRKAFIRFCPNTTLSFLAATSEGIIDRFNGKGLSSAVYPDAALLPRPGGAVDGAHHDVTVLAVQFQHVPGEKLQLLTQAFRNDETSGFIDRRSETHNTIIKW